MALPIAFLLGLLVIVTHRELALPLPGQDSVEGVAMAAAWLAIPWLFAFLAKTQARRALVLARSVVVPPQALLWLSVAATPIVLHALFEYGRYGDFIERLAPDSHLLRILLALLPLYLTELPRCTTATMAEALLEVDMDSRNQRPIPSAMLPRAHDVWPFVRLRFGWPLLALLPAVLLGLSLDLLLLHRESYVLVLATSFGTTLATVGFLLTTAMLLPFWFRIAFGTSSELPEPVGTSLRRTAQELGFPPRRVLLLPTGMRTMNAMMVGPLPIGRLLCLTDGLLSTLDSRSLSGVLAHEIGHARMGHPGILMLLAVLLPLLFLVPLRLVEIDQLDVALQLAGLVAMALSFWLVVRTLARRFEHEADAASVRSLGAEPCSRALLLVSRLALPVVRRLPGRLFSLHPDEQQRLLSMRRYEQDPAFRERFDRRSRQLRRVVLGLVAIAICIAAWSWRLDWQYERVLVRFHTGDFVGAQQLMPVAAETPTRWRRAFERIREELAAGLELAPDARDWSTAKRALDPAAWQRGERVLLVNGPVAARPWFALAVSAMPSPSATKLAIYEYCEAAAAGDVERVELLGQIVYRNGPPPTLARVFEGYRQ